MDGKLEGTRSPKLEPIPRHLSTFEMSVNLEFQAGTPQKGAAIPKAGDSDLQPQSANLTTPACLFKLAGCFTGKTFQCPV